MTSAVAAVKTFTCESVLNPSQLPLTGIVEGVFSHFQLGAALRGTRERARGQPHRDKFPGGVAALVPRSEPNGSNSRGYNE